MTSDRETRGKARLDDQHNEVGHKNHKSDEHHEKDTKHKKEETASKHKKADEQPEKDAKKQKVDHGTRGAKGKKEKDQGDQDMNGADDSAEEYQSFLEKLKEECPIQDLRAICSENGLDSTAPDDMIILGCADQLFYGPLETCPICDAGLVFAGHDYKCSGFISEWSKCNYSAHEAQRLKGSLKIPKKLKNDFLKEVARGIVLHSSDGLRKWQWEKSHDASKLPVRQLPAGDKPFAGMTIVLSGRMSRPQGEIKAEIEKYGGKVGNAVREGVTCVVAPANEAQSGGSSKLAEATERNVPVVREKWIFDCIEEMAPQPLEAYDMAAELPGDHEIPWDKKAPHEEAAESLMAELKLVGKRGIYKDTELAEEGGKIYEKNGLIYNCAFSICDMTAGLNQYAILELIEMPKGAIYLYYKKGRVGDRLHNSERLDEMESARDALKEFVKLFEQLTGNKFEPWERQKKIEKKRNKFYPIDMGGGVDARAGGLGVRQLGIAAAHSQLDSRVVETLKILYSQEVYRFALLEMGIDAPDLPTGNLTEYHLQLCEDVLLQFAEFLRKGETDEKKHERMCLDFSNKWWSLLHTTRPFVITSLSQLAEVAAPTLESVKAISTASQLIGDMTGATLDDPLADRYLNLGCQITPLDRDGDDYKMILNYMTKTMEPIKFGDVEFGVMMEDACMIESKNNSTLADMEKMSNKVLIWCGTRTSNLLACMHVGMPPAIFAAPAPGYMFGKGIYCTDAAVKAAQYGFTAVDRPEGFLILAIVSLGDEVLELTQPEKDVSKYEKKKVAIKVLGKKTTDEKEYVKWKHDVTVPCGSLIPSSHEDSPLEYNEYCVYNPRQVLPLFLVRTRFEITA